MKRRWSKTWFPRESVDNRPWVDVMKWRNRLFTLSFLASWVLFPVPSVLSQTELWKRIDDGLSLAEFQSQGVTVVRVAPTAYSYKLLSASEYNNVRMTAKKWSQAHNLVSATNAGMFLPDGVTNVGYMKNFNHVNSPRLGTSYNAVLAFNRVDATVPEVQIIDLKCQEFGRLKEKYQTFVQGMRMVSCRQENVWEKQDRMWSIAAFGMDKGGNGLFIFGETPYSVHDFTQLLLSLPVLLYNAMYLEGGPEATLYFSAGGVEFEKVGKHQTALSENGFQRMARSLPNVIGIRRK
jgi:hypothetical protein